jgi:hypothetical protein
MGIKYLRNIELDATHNITFGLTVIWLCLYFSHLHELDF